jgi:hypothetical protein
MHLRQFSGGEFSFTKKDDSKRYEWKNKVLPQGLFLKSKNHF